MPLCTTNHWSQMRSLSPVAAADLAHLACPYCGTTMSPDAEWVARAIRAWGLCGWRLGDQEQTDALLLIAPSQSEPGAAMIKRMWVVPDQVGRTLGKRLIQGTAAALMNSSTRAILSRGSRAHSTCAAPPKEFLKAVGFTRQLDERYYRLDLNRATTSRNALQSLLDKVAEVLHPSPGEPAPGGFSPRAAHRAD